jgi:hypothetical protein
MCHHAEKKSVGFHAPHEFVETRCWICLVCIECECHFEVEETNDETKSTYNGVMDRYLALKSSIQTMMDITFVSMASILETQ